MYKLDFGFGKLHGYFLVNLFSYVKNVHNVKTKSLYWLKNKERNKLHTKYYLSCRFNFFILFLEMKMMSSGRVGSFSYKLIKKKLRILITKTLKR